MKRTLFILLSVAGITTTYAQAVNPNQEKIRIIFAEKMISKKPTIMLIGAHIRVENKLDVEADSILVNRDRTEFTAYKMKSFTFTGRVVVGKENKGICKFRLGEDTLVIE